MPRLTITLADDLYAMARAHAISSGLSISKAIDDLLRQRSGVAASGAAAGKSPRVAEKDDAPSYFDPELGLRVSRADRTITSEDVRRAEEEEDNRIAEAGGLLKPSPIPR